MTKTELFAAIEKERHEQKQAGFTNDHDAEHSPADWHGLLSRHVGLMVNDGGGIDENRYRKQLVRIAAIAVAALEQFHKKPLGELDSRQKGPGW